MDLLGLLFSVHHASQSVEVWFEGATKLIVCYLSLPEKRNRDFAGWLAQAEETVLSGAVMLDFEQRARWYGGLAGVMERASRTELLVSEYRDKERQARRRMTAGRR